MARPGLVRVASGAQEARLRLCKRPDDSGGLLLALQGGLPGRLEPAGGGEFRGLLEGRSLRLRGVIGDLGHL